MRILKLLIAIPLIIIMAIIVVINTRIHHEATSADVLNELRGLKMELDHNADVDMQKIFPEGYVFMNATYALAWSSFLKSNTEYFDEGYTEIDKAWQKINFFVGERSQFSAYYHGWQAYVLGCKLKIKSSEEIDQFKQQCDSIVAAITRTTYPPSYVGASWPADATVCVATLSIHDQIFEPKYHDVIKKWLSEVKSKLDIHGMIPHSLHENSRGSSMALMLIFLHDIDKDFAQQQFNLFKEKFIDDAFGLTGIREYPKGEEGNGDIDSGPVIMGFGGAATIVGMHTLACYGEDELSVRIRNAVDAVYIFGLLPMADAFITWSHSGLNDSRIHPRFVDFYLYSLVIFVLIAISFWFLVKK